MRYALLPLGLLLAAARGALMCAGLPLLLLAVCCARLDGLLFPLQERLLAPWFFARED